MALEATDNEQCYHDSCKNHKRIVGGAVVATSKLQTRTGELLRAKLGHKYTIKENVWEFWCLGHNRQRLELDFYIEELGVAIEVQGIQHYKYTPFFHANYEAFLDQQMRDKAKKTACIQNEVTLYELDDERSLQSVLNKVAYMAKYHKPYVKASTQRYWNGILNELIFKGQEIEETKDQFTAKTYTIMVEAYREKVLNHLKAYQESGIKYHNKELSAALLKALTTNLTSLSNMDQADMRRTNRIERDQQKRVKRRDAGLYNFLRTNQPSAAKGLTLSEVKKATGLSRSKIIYAARALEKLHAISYIQLSRNEYRFYVTPRLPLVVDFLEHVQAVAA